MKTKLIKKQDGFMVSEAIIAILIVIMFAGIIASLMYNIVLTSRRIKINSKEIEYVTGVLNYTNLISYDEVTTENLIAYINEKTENKDLISAGENISELTTPYKMSIDVQSYEPTDTTIEKKDLIKTIKVRVECKFGKKTYSTEMSTLRKIKDTELRILL